MKAIAIIGNPEYTTNYQLALRKAGASEKVFSSYEDLARHHGDFDGLLLPGGGDIDPSLYGAPNLGSRNIDAALDKAQFLSLQLFHQKEKPVLGICKGMQVINVYFHGTICQDLSYVKLHQQPEGDIYHTVNNRPGFFLHALYGSYMLTNSNHHQAVQTLGRSLHSIQKGPDNVIEAISHYSDPIIGLQWHPERISEEKCPESLLVFRYFISLC